MIGLFLGVTTKSVSRLAGVAINGALALTLILTGAMFATNAQADEATLDMLKQVVGASGTPDAMRGSLPPGLELNAQKHFDFQGNTPLVGAKIELDFSRSPTFDQNVGVEVMLGKPREGSVSGFIQQITEGTAATESVSCGDQGALLMSGDDGTTISIVTESNGRALIIQTTESYNTPFRHGEAILRNIAIAACRMFASGEDGSADEVASTPPPPAIPEEPYDPFDYSDIIIEMEQPDKLVDSGVQSGKAYLAVLPDNEILNVLDRPSGNVVGSLDGSDGEIRARYYYTADVYNVWAGVCSSTGTCGWVSADYLFSLSPGEADLGIYSITPDSVRVYDGPSRSANPIGKMYYRNQVMMVQEADSADGRWAKVCRMESCGWVPLEFITFEF